MICLLDHLSFDSNRTLSSLHRLSYRLRRSVQCRPIPRRVKSVHVGVDGYRSLYRIQRSRSRMGDLRHRLVHPRRWCPRTSHTDQEPHQQASSSVKSWPSMALSWELCTLPKSSRSKRACSRQGRTILPATHSSGAA